MSQERATSAATPASAWATFMERHYVGSAIISGQCKTGWASG